MRITVKPPSPAPSPPLAPGALLTVRVEAADPRPLLAGPPAITYEGRYVDTPAPGAFLFPAGDPARGVSTAAPSASDFRRPPSTPLQTHVDVDATPGDTITATLITPPPNGKAYTAALTAPAAPHSPTPPPVVLQLVEGGAATPQPPPQPAPGLTITPHPDDEDVWTLDTAPGADDLIVVN